MEEAPCQGTFDTITNLQYGQGKVLEVKYTDNSLLLYGDLVRKDIWLQVIGPRIGRPATSSLVKILYGNESPDTVIFPMLIEFGSIDGFDPKFEYVHFPSWIPWEDPAAEQAFLDEVRDIFFEGEGGSIPFMLTIPGRKPGDQLPGFPQSSS